jgi:CheY-like chemotaxis protein
LRLLVVEDEAMNRALFRASMDRFAEGALKDAELVEAETLAEARQAMAGGAFEIVLLDVRLPDGNGLEFAAELRALPEAARPRVLILSASVLPEERAQALASGAEGFIGKPYRPDELIEAIRGLLRHPQ